VGERPAPAVPCAPATQVESLCGLFRLQPEDGATRFTMREEQGASPLAS
jgi:hypothetical protein